MTTIATQRHVWAVDVAAALNALPAVQSVAVRLLYFDKLPERDVAVRMGIELSEARAAAAQGLRRLGQLLCGEPARPALTVTGR